MSKKVQIIPIPNGNSTKYFSYREAWGRINGAIARGFYLEAVTLEESIISDRLISYLCKTKVLVADEKTERKNFSQLIAKWKKQVPNPISDKYYDDLQTSLDNWRESRNKIVHGMVKSIPGKDHQDILDFKEEAKIAAIQGERLARSLCNWSKRINKQLSKENLDCGD